MRPTTKWKSRSLQKKTSKRRSALEDHFERFLQARGVKYAYEQLKVYFTPAPKKRSKLFDWFGPRPKKGERWRIVETKGYWHAKSRLAETLAIEQNPQIEVMYLFQNPNLPIVKGSKTTYAMWCEKKQIAWTESFDVAAKWLGTEAR